MRLLNSQFRYYAAVLLLSSALSATSFVKAQQKSSNSSTSEQDSSAEPVLLTVTVTDKAGRYLGGLDKSAFSVRDNELPQAITCFSNSDVPISIGILLDVSGSLAMTLDSNRLLGADENNVKQVIGEGLSEFHTIQQYLKRLLSYRLQ